MSLMKTIHISPETARLIDDYGISDWHERYGNFNRNAHPLAAAKELAWRFNKPDGDEYWFTEQELQVLRSFLENQILDNEDRFMPSGERYEMYEDDEEALDRMLEDNRAFRSLLKKLETE